MSSVSACPEQSVKEGFFYCFQPNVLNNIYSTFISSVTKVANNVLLID